jgi:hypothetical protein
MEFPWFGKTDEIKQRKFACRPIIDDMFDGCSLIFADANKFVYNYNKDDPYDPKSELHWRSAVIDQNGMCISGGLPKFHDFGVSDAYGQFSIVDRIISRAIQTKEAIITKKEDGTLIIRSVYNEKVILRTRQKHNLYMYEDRVLSVIKEKYPILLDPKFLPFLDLHFEYVAPDNTIIIRYDEKDLIFLHAKYRDTFKMLSWEELENIASQYNLKLVEKFDNMNNLCSAKKIKEFIDQENWKHEGVVVRDSISGLMCRIKAEKYKELFAAKYSFSPKKFFEICRTQNFRTLEEAIAYLSGVEVDVSLFDDQLKRWFDLYCERKEKYDKLVEDKLEKIEMCKKSIDTWAKSVDEFNYDGKIRKKKFVEYVKEIHKEDFALMMSVYNNEEEEYLAKYYEKIGKDLIFGLEI